MLQRLRLLSGLILFAYVAGHLLNHALGLVSLQTAELVRRGFIGFWRSPIGTPLLYGALIGHLALVLWALYQRRHLRMPGWEIFRLGLGLLIPLQLIPHIFGTRVVYEVTDIAYPYAKWMLLNWVMDPTVGLQQLALLVVAWVHGCMGIHYWLRVKPWHAVTVPTLRVLGLLVPVLAVVGFLDMGKEVAVLAADPTWVQRFSIVPSAEDAARITAWRNLTLGLFGVLVGGVFVARRVRTGWERHRKGVVRLTYPSGRQVLITPGMSVLEASRLAGIPHASLCGGRGRCSTCRVRVGAGLEALPSPTADEARVLRRVGAAPNVRLACQLRPTADLDVFPLLPPTITSVSGFVGQSQIQGREQEIAILFSDLRSFTRFSEHRLPYDVVFVLNQYFATMGAAVEGAGGYLDKFIGDGVMALFGLDDEPATACRQALRAALDMTRGLAELNRVLRPELAEPLRMGIGIHVGPVIVGEMGHSRARSLTAIGDAANTASRLEALNKEYGSLIIFSEDVANRAGVDCSAFPSHEIEVRGRTTPLTIYAIAEPAELAQALEQPDFSVLRSS
jgi:adenylate cyclase